MSKVRTLIVDDERLARRRLRSLLERMPRLEIVGECVDGLEAVRAIEDHKPDLVFLDVQMPELDGFGVIRRVGARRMPPVVFVTAYDQYAVRAFEIHALDYLLKPFDEERLQAAVSFVLAQFDRSGVRELNQRLVSLLEGQVGKGGADALGKPQGDNEAAQVSFGDVEVDLGRHAVKRKGQSLSLRPKEFDLLAALIKRQGRLATRLELLQEVWGYDQAVVSRTVDTHIAELRRKLEDDPGNPQHILTVRKNGYRLNV